jgi:CRP-like cAMP-binding protein
MFFEHLIQNLGRRDHISDAERQLLEQLPRRTRPFQNGEEVVREGSRPSDSCLIVSGLAARAQFLHDGKRQLAALHVPGDFIDLHALLLKLMDHSVVAIGTCEAAFIPHASLLSLIESAPHLGRLFWLSTVIDGAIQRTWITSLGRRSPTMHIAHLICELYVRLELIGLAQDQSFEFPATQNDIADMVGLSLVHVNRTIQDLRLTQLVRWQNRVVTVPDIDRLRRFAEFDPTYLNLINEPR